MRHEIYRDGVLVHVTDVPEQMAELREAIKAECRRRIYTVATAETQMNMTAAMAAGLLDGPATSSFAASLAWVAAMRTACADLIQDADATYADDQHWPPCPADVVALAAAY